MVAEPSFAMFEKRFLFVLAAALIFKTTQQQFQRSVPSCTTNGQTFCWSCNTRSSCVLSGGTLKQYNTTCTVNTPLCGPDSITPTKYVCTNNVVADCTCKVTTGLSYQRDPYNDQWYITCSGSTATYIDCGAGQYYDEVTHRCGNTPPPPTTTTTPSPSICAVLGPGVHDDPSNCDSYYVCQSADAEPVSYTCTDSEYFNSELNQCTTKTPPFKCPPGVFANFGDSLDCRRYFVCFDTELLDVGCCDASKIYNETLEDCTEDPAPEGCPFASECAKDNATTSTTISTSTSTSTSTPSSASTPSTSTLTSDSTLSSASTPSTSTLTSDSTPSSASTQSTSTLTSDSTPSSASTPSTSTLTSDSTPSSTSTPSTSTLTSDSTPSSTTTSTSTSTATTNPGPSCTPISSYICPAADGYYPQCTYCAKTYFHCVSGTATLGSCTGDGVFNTVPAYPSCLSPQYCPQYP